MDTFWQVVIGVGIGTLLLNLFYLYKSYIKESKEHNESQTLAKWSIISGLSGIILIFIGSTIGILLAILSIRRNNYNTLAKIGLLISILTALPWLAVLIFGK
jgi:hypothetical protein